MDLKIKNLELKIKNETILSIKSLFLKSSQTLIVTGESGSGKTTFLNIISLLETPSSAQIWWDKTEVSSLSQTQKDKFRALNFGVVMQNFHLFSNLNAVENIMILNLFLPEKKISKQTALKLLNELNIPNPYQQIKYNSRGQMQRVAIARALATKPLVLICDEPTSSLDSKNSMLITNLLKDYAKENSATMIIATHDQNLKSAFKNRVEIKKNQEIVWE